jgi:hypothetical protein
MSFHFWSNEIPDNLVGTDKMKAQDILSGNCKVDLTSLPYQKGTFVTSATRLFQLVWVGYDRFRDQPRYIGKLMNTFDTPYLTDWSQEWHEDLFHNEIDVI